MSLVAVCFFALFCGELRGQYNDSWDLTNAVRSARTILAARQSGLSEAELERLSGVIGLSNHLARAIPESIQRKDFARADRLLKEFTGNINDLKLFGQPMVYQAVQMGQNDQLEFLLQHHANPNEPVPGGQTPLCQAVQFHRWKQALRLIDAGAIVARPNPWGQTPLGLFVEGMWGPMSTNDESYDLLEALLAKGASPFVPARTSDARSVLEEALMRQIPVAELLLTNRPNVLLRTPGGETALHLAALWGRTNAVEFLLNAGFSADLTNAYGLTPLQRIADTSGEALTVIFIKTNGSRLALPASIYTGKPASVLQTRVWRGSRPAFWPGGSPNASHAAVAAELLNHGATLDVFCAAALGLTNELAALLHAHPELANARDSLGRTPLHYSVSAQEVASTRLLLNAGGKHSVPSTGLVPGFQQEHPIPAGTTPMHLAALRGDEHLLRMLLRVGADIAAADAEGNTPLHLSARSWQTNGVALLVAARAPLDVTNRAGQTPLRLAVESSSTANVELLLKAGADPAAGLSGETLLHVAAEHGNADVVKTLLSHGLALQARDKDGRTPFQRAVAAPTRQWETLNLLLAKGSDVNARDTDGNSALHSLAALQEDNINHMIQPSWWDAWKERCLMRPGLKQQTLAKLIQWKWLASPPGTMWTNTSLTEWLLQHGAKVNQTNRLGQTPLYVLCQAPWITYGVYQMTNRFALLLGAGAKVEAADVHGVASLHVAATNAQPAIIAMMAHRVPDRASLRDAEGRTPLHYAAHFRQTGLDDGPARLVALFEGRLEPNVSDNEGRTPLHEALASHLDFPWMSADGILLTLLSNRANPNLPDTRGSTALHLAVKAWANPSNGAPYGMLRDVSLLLTNGANPNLPDRQGRTALHWLAGASRNGWSSDSSLDQVLLGADWDPTIRDKTGQAPIHLLASNLYPYAIPMAGLKKLLTNQLAINLTNGAGDTPLLIAVRAGEFQVVKLLLEAGADTTLRNVAGESAWRLAATAEPGGMIAQTVRPPGAKESFFYSISAHDHASFDAWLAADPAVCSVTNVHGQTPLMRATESNQRDKAQRLLDLGAPLDAVSALRLNRLAEFHKILEAQTGPIPANWLFEAVQHKRFEALHEMVGHGADVGSVDDEGHSLLYRTLERKSPDTAEWLETNGCHKTVFDAIADGDRGGFVKFLDSGKCGADTTNRQGRTLLMETVIAGQPEMAAVLVGHGARIDLRTGEGWTALHLAAAKDQVEAGDLLLKAGANPNQLAGNGMGPLHIAAFFGRTNFMWLLLTNGAEVNLRPPANGSFGNTPLIWAAHRGGVDAVRILLVHGADPKARNNSGADALAMVGSNGRGTWYAFPAPSEISGSFRRTPTREEQAATRAVLEAARDK